MMSNQWRDWCRSALTALVTVSIAVTALAQPQNQTRIGNNNSEFGDFNRLIRDGARDTFGPRNNSLQNQTQVDLERVDKRVLQNLLTECVSESEQLYRSLQKDYQRYPAVRPFLSDLISLRARAARTAQDLQAGESLARLLPQFQQLASDWRLTSHQMTQTGLLSRTSLQSVERIDRLERELEKLFKMDPQLDWRELTIEVSRLESAIRNLVQELELDANSSDQMFQLVLDARKLDQQAYRIQRMVVDHRDYSEIVSEYERFDQMWRIVAPKLRRINSRYIERSVSNVIAVDSRLHDLLWLEQETSRENLKRIADALIRDVDEFFNRVPLKLLVHFKDVSSILATADDYYGTVQNLKDVIDRDEDERSILESYRYVEEYGLQFVRAFEPLRSSAGRVVLREIEDGMVALRNELNIAGTVTSIDTQKLVPTAASLENLADHLEFDVQQWLNAQRPSYRAQALQAAARFRQRAQKIHRLLQTRPTANQLKQEVSNLSEEFRTIYQYLGRCNTQHRSHLRVLAFDIGDAINSLQKPLQL